MEKNGETTRKKEYYAILQCSTFYKLQYLTNINILQIRRRAKPIFESFIFIRKTQELAPSARLYRRTE